MNFLLLHRDEVDDRGIARLQLGDQQGAQEDFAKFEAWLGERQSGP